MMIFGSGTFSLWTANLVHACFGSPRNANIDHYFITKLHFDVPMKLFIKITQFI